MNFFRKSVLLFFAVLFVVPIAVSAQYKGLPVQKDKLLQVLQSKRFQARDIVQIINESGVDFQLTPALENQLVAAGARPTVLEAIRKNYRVPVKQAASGGKGKPAAGKLPPVTTPASNDYNGLLNGAVNAYDISKNSQQAINLLQQAAAMQPNNPRAYQLLGFVSLYGTHDFDAAERYWKTSISLGGNAVLRVIHDHDGSFLTSCQGSLYIAKNIVRFESDNNQHTFETTDSNIKKIEVNNKWLRLVQLKGGSFKLVLKKEDGQSKYNFAPVSGKTDDSKMIIRLIGK
ncbi:hypothetical protein BH10ACI3_BH10ACI3_10960 [soil metagenome]